MPFAVARSSVVGPRRRGAHGRFVTISMLSTNSGVRPAPGSCPLSVSADRGPASTMFCQSLCRSSTVDRRRLSLHSPVDAIEWRSKCSKFAQRSHSSARRRLFDQTRRSTTTFMVAASARAQRATFEIVSIVPSISMAWAIVPTTMITARIV